MRTILDFVDAFFAPVRLWRIARGGHWELWWVDSPVNGDVWHRVESCSILRGTRPSPLCRGIPECEDRS